MAPEPPPGPATQVLVFLAVVFVIVSVFLMTLLPINGAPVLVGGGAAVMGGTFQLCRMLMAREKAEYAVGYTWKRTSRNGLWQLSQQRSRAPGTGPHDAAARVLSVPVLPRSAPEVGRTQRNGAPSDWWKSPQRCFRWPKRPFLDDYR